MDGITFSENLAMGIQRDIATLLKDMGEMKQEVSGIKKEVSEIKQTMATKHDIRELREEMTRNDNTIRTEMATKEGLRNYATLSDVRNIVSDAKNEILKEVDHLRIRTSRVEEKVGISPAHG